MYKLWRPSSIISVTFASIILSCIPVIFILDSATITEKVVTALTMLTLVGILTAIAVKDILDRKKVLDTVVRQIGPLLFIDKTSDGSGKKFIDGLPLDIAFHIEIALIEAFVKLSMTGVSKVDQKNLEPYTFVTLKDKGTVRWVWGTTEKTVRGVAKGHHCEIESLDRMSTMQLLKHEVGHAILDGTKHKDTETHHKVMSKAGF